MKTHISAKWYVFALLVSVMFASGVYARPAKSVLEGGKTDPRSAKLAELPLAAQAQISATLGREHSRYHAAQIGESLRMQNASHGLTADFTAAGIKVRTGAAIWKMELSGYGYADQLRNVSSVEPHAAGNRVEYQRGELTEWYLNGPLGLEQGFTVARAPGKCTGEPLTLAFTLSGNLTASVDANGRDLILSRSDGMQILRYRGLTAHDSTGRELGAWLQVRGEQLFLRADDAGAQYPIVVDPIVQHAKLTAPDGAASDQFGGVSLDGDTLVVGARLDDVGANINQGSAYVFTKPAGGWGAPFAEPARLIASDGAANDVFGAVAIYGDTIVAGAMGCPNTNVCNTQPVAAKGAAYVFVQPAGGWSGTLNEQAKLIASDGAGNDLFGSSVAIEGDTIVVAAEWDDFFRGSAYVFVKPSEGWNGTRTQSAKLIASDRAIGSGIGNAFGRPAISGDTIVMGALGSDVLTPTGFNLTDAGAAYVFVKPATGWSGTLTQQAKLIASDRATSDRFGTGVAVRGDVIAVGAHLDDVGAIADRGSAYVFVRPAAGWSGTLAEQAKLIASDAAAGDELGITVRDRKSVV